ncbi:MAG: SpvB/TcaC N-terminal domain-containing protein [Waterburya sp.]
MSNKSGTSSQIISAPKGGGALQGIGEKFAPDLYTGTGNFTIPIALPPGRQGFQPQLNLVYSTGSGNGEFGLGWGLSIPGVMRKTAEGIPRYDDSQDIFILSGAEDLVPIERQSSVTRYQPRTEGLFARILHHRDLGNDYWEVRSKDGLVSLYGTPEATSNNPAAIANPTNPTQIFAWKLTRTTDLFGNRIEYLYERDAVRVTEGHQWDRLYLAEIRYGDYGDSANPQFLVRVKFSYEERPDPFSEYRSGFEIRTIRRCTQIEVLTQPEREILTRTYNLIYLDQRNDLPNLEQLLPINGVSLLSQVRVVGHDDEATQDLPPLEFGYTQFAPQGRKFFPLAGADLPSGSLGRPEYELADLLGNGLPDILEMNGTVRYWRNLGNGKFDRPRSMSNAPAGLQLADPNVQLIDANGDGRIDLLVNREGLSGYFPLRFGGLWDKRSLQRYQFAPSFSLEEPEVKLVDLTGDGVTDAIRSGSRLECFFNDPKQGWKETRWVERRALKEFPNLNFSDPRVKWGDMSGDGLQDILLVHDGNVEYWSNLGYGNWGQRISMRNNPRFRYGYDPRRILVDDVDGDGLADIVYVDDRKVILWINQSGNSWSDPIEIKGTPPVSDLDSVRLVDLLGTGIRGVLWSADANGLNRPNMFFLDFTGGVKPYLLNRMDNHMGSLTLVNYAPSVRFYLEDEKRRETRWKTHLPFPVQVVAKVEAIDQISQGKLTTEYRYHHGYWDGAEREFRGFGRVEQRDTEIFEEFNQSGLHSDQLFEIVEATKFTPPLETRTWFHQGPVGDEFGDWEELDFSDEYWSGDLQVLSRPQSMTDFLKGLPRRKKRDALRTLRGSILRTELYALDATERQARPYTVTESLQGVREESPPTDDGDNRPAIFFSFSLAQRTTQWERGEEPMTQFGFMGDYDRYGMLLAQMSIAVPRGRDFRVNAPSLEPYLATYAETIYAVRDDEQKYIVDRVARSTASEILNDGSTSVFELWEMLKAGTASQKVIAQTLSYYDGNAFEGLPFQQIGEFGALTRTESLVMTSENLEEAYRSEDTVLNPPEIPPYLQPTGTPVWTADYPEEFRDRLPTLAGYIYHSGGEYETGYFVTTERRRYDFHNGQGRGLVLEQRDPLGRSVTINYDRFDLLPERVTDPIGLITTAEYDYRVLQPRQVTEPNGNQSRFTFTPLGLLGATFLQGKAGEGDRQRPSMRMEYDFLAFTQRSQPISVRTIQHIHHDTEADIPLPKRDETIETIEYSDGFGRLLQTRVQGEEERFGDSVFGGAILPIEQGDETSDRREVAGRTNFEPNNPNVVVSGWQIYDNKGRIVAKYEPFFATGWDYIAPLDAQFGQKVEMFYDPRGQVILTINPDGSQQRVIYGIPTDLTNPDVFVPTPWEAYTYDANDLAPQSYHPTEEFPDGSPKPLTDRAPTTHHFTPASIEIDALGRTIEAVERNGSNPSTDWYVTRSTYDIRGNLLTVTDALGRVAFTYSYDLANHPLRVKSIDAGVRRTIMDAVGNALEQRDSKGALVLNAYDDLNRLIRMWARDGVGQILTLRERSLYGDSTETGLSAAERLAANLLGKLYQHYDEAGRMTVTAYDFKGNVLEKQRQVIQDEPILSVFAGATANNWQIEAFRVDWQPPTGETLETHANNLLDSAIYRTSMTYDALNRPKVMQYPQDVEGNRKVLRPIYNRAGALERVELDSAVYVERIAYNAKGQRVLIAYGNGVMTRYAYDPQTFRLVRLRTEKYAQPDPLTYQPTGVPLQDFAYQYDLVGNILNIQDWTSESGILNNPEALPVSDPQLAQLLASGNALIRQFEYDPIYRLLTATGRECDRPPESPPWDDRPRCADLTRTRGYRERYQYDPMGNMVQLQHINDSGARNRDFTLVAGNNRLDTVTVGQTDYQYLYDVNGNLVQENTSRHFEWDYGDRMRVFRTQTEGAEPSVYAYYLYDSTGMRVKKLVRKQGGQVEVTVYIDGIFEYHRTVQGNRTRENNTLHVMDDQSRIALVRVGNPFPDDTTPAVKYHLGDHLGSSNVVVDEVGNWVNREEYTPYGETSFGSFARKRYRYTGKERDEESGLYYHGARNYAPWLARWVSCDPLGMRDGVNLYRYVSNNPVALNDPSGMEGETPQLTTYFEYEFTGKETQKELHSIAAEHGWLFEGSATWENGSWLVNGTVSPLPPGEEGEKEKARLGALAIAEMYEKILISEEADSGISNNSNSGNQKKDSNSSGSKLDFATALSSVILEPGSLYEGYTSDAEVSGSPVGSKSGYITGDLAEVLTIVGAVLSVVGGWLSKKVGGWFKKVFNFKKPPLQITRIIENPTLDDIKALIPEGMNLQEWGGMIWGSGQHSAWEYLGKRSAEELRKIPGLTVESATTLRNWFQNMPSGMGGQAPSGRVELLNEIIQKLGG